ncbi:MAG: class I SAM-dependent methyltransferase [Myxococcales bacterium]|nr:class I SAM-dependent methyltransferase [Myxococcales bacterium]MCB9541516.1 class I SAM-dependent methyltransferase [Myxococcales bacterium]
MSDDPVTRQFTAHPYPAIDPDAALLDGRATLNDPGVFAPIYWPDRPPPAGLAILVAGCGTFEAVALARRHPDARVVGVDVSEPALARQRRIADRHGVTNLELVACALEDIERLGQTFDFISAAGVLHHLADPAAGLGALGRVLRKRGVVSAAVYGATARAGLAAVQAALAGAGLGHDPQDLHVARQLLAALPAHHPAQSWIARTGERGALDAHLVDSYLPAREASYDVPALLALVDAAGLAFAGWLHNAPYHPDSLFVPGTPAHHALDRLPPAAMWAACARLTAPLDHWFIAAREDSPTRRVDLDAADLLDAVPGRRHPPGPGRPPMPYDPRDPLQEALYTPIDGRRTVREVLLASGVEGPFADRVALARRFVRHLWRTDGLYLRLPAAPTVNRG